MKSNYSAWEISEQAYPQQAQQQWQFLIGYGALAASTFNAQPWKCRLTEQGIDVLLDRAKLPTKSDKTGRFGFISMGCFIANIEIAASYFNWQTEVVYHNNSQPGLELIATIKFSPGQNQKLAQLFKQIPHRVTNRSLHTQQPLPDSLADQLIEYLIGSTQIALVGQNYKAEIKQISQDADLAIWSDIEFRREHVSWVRNNFTRQLDGMPGFGVGVKNIPSLLAKPIILSNKFAAIQAAKNQTALESSTAYMVISGPDNNQGWLNAGRSFQSIALYLSKLGMAVAPMGQFIEHEQARQKLSGLIDNQDGLSPQLFCRVGYPSQPVRHSPRKRPEDIIVQ
jgi:hypothetical protein